MKSATRNELHTTARVLHELFKSLPIIRQHSGPEAVQRQMKLIAYFQKQHDALALKLR